MPFMDHDIHHPSAHKLATQHKRKSTQPQPPKKVGSPSSLTLALQPEEQLAPPQPPSPLLFPPPPQTGPLCNPPQSLSLSPEGASHTNRWCQVRAQPRYWCDAAAQEEHRRPNGPITWCVLQDAPTWAVTCTMCLMSRDPHGLPLFKYRRAHKGYLDGMPMWTVVHEGYLHGLPMWAATQPALHGMPMQADTRICMLL